MHTFQLFYPEYMVEDFAIASTTATQRYDDDVNDNGDNIKFHSSSNNNNNGSNSKKNTQGEKNTNCLIRIKKLNR